MADDLARQAAELPDGPGVYLFRDAAGEVLYVGKAVDLRARVRQYLSGSDERAMVPFLVSEAAEVEVVVVHTEKEALLLENTLIKQHRPRYNVKLRDDSNFLHLHIDPDEDWPRWRLVRSLRAGRGRTFGPYASATRARRTLAFVQRSFPLRSCTDAVLRSRRRPCLLHQMGRCAAPCVGRISREDYAGLVEESMLLVQGRRRELVERLGERMRAAADEEAFEEAARLRDLVQTLEATLERQEVVDPRRQDRDVWGLHREGPSGTVAVLPVRDGALGEPRTHDFDSAAGRDDELLSSLVNATYAEGADIPPEVLVPALPPDHAALEEVLAERRGGRVRLHAPRRGRKVELVRLARDNARVRYQSRVDAAERHRRAMARLAELLDLPGPPGRMECFDNSNLEGTDPVAAMAVFTGGRPDRREYRRYRVKTVVGADDYATMREILQRRVRRGLDEGLLPDLLVVDGGRGQVSVAREVLEEAGVELPLVGLAKPRSDRRRGHRRATDRIVFPTARPPLRLPVHDPALRLLQHLRDEAHRHAVRYHRKVRTRGKLVSALEEIEGVGPARARALLEHLGSARAVMEASPDELVQVPGIGPALARRIREALG